MRRGEVTLKNVPERPEIPFWPKLINNRVGLLMLAGGGGGSWSSQYGQMGNGRSPTDPIFFLHHAAVDKLWHDWQNNDPSHFNDLGGSGTTRANTQLSTQWPSVTAGDMLDSEGDLKVCYSEPKPTLIGPIIKCLSLCFF